MRFLSLIIITAFIGCTPGKNIVTNKTASPFQAYIDSVEKIFAPDKRTVVFSVSANNNVLKGETSDATAKSDLLNKITAAGFTFIDSIEILPEAELEQQTKAVVTISVANIRTQPAHKAELATQATLGTPVQILKKERGWYLIQTPDKYLGWVDAAGIEQMDEKKFKQWQGKTKIIFTAPYGFAYATPSDAETVSDLVYGSVLSLSNSSNDFFEVVLPDGRKAFVPKSQSQLYSDWKNSRQPTTENFVQMAKKFLGIPYLWGGTSFKGVDCSGFTKTVYFMNGLVLPRDASQQVMIGEEIDTQAGWQNLQPGDLLFFGSKATDNRGERVVHVGMWIGNNEFIHAAGKVRINSMDPTAANYDESEHKRFLRAKRISPQASLINLRTTNLYQLPTEL